MSNSAAHDVRVILVGRTGLDAALRLDSGIELVRVHTPLEAVGELASPVDPFAPSRAVVVVAPEVEAALRGTANGSAHGPGIDNFIRGLRVAVPGVVVMGIARNGSVGAPPGPGLDATIEAELPADTIRMAIRRQAGIAIESAPVEKAKIEPPRAEPPRVEPPRAEPPRAEPARTETARVEATRIETTQARSTSADVPAARPLPPAKAEPAQEPPPHPSLNLGQSGDVGDLALASLLVKGQDVLAAAIELVRVRTGDDSVEFIPFSADGAEPKPKDQPVAWEGTVLGHLRAQQVSEPVLAVHAHWLAAWLRARDQQAQLRAAAFSDPLTGAYNRRYFERFLATALDQAREARRHLSVFVFDIDDFKTYNDKYGHDAGDEILRETVRLMRSVIRPTDRVCRIGGDEFAVIFNEPTGPRVEGSRHPNDVFNLAQRFQQQVRQHRFPKLSDCLPGTLTVSGGLATYPWDGTTPEQLLLRADQNALASKRQGKNAITFGPNV